MSQGPGVKGRVVLEGPPHLGHEQRQVRHTVRPVAERVQTDVASGVHAGTGRVDHHGDRWTDVTARPGRRVGLMKPDAHWDIILASFILDGNRPSQVDQLLLLFVGKTVKIHVETKIREK